MSDISAIIIEGITHSGEKFRPSDWAERTCGTLSTLHNHRIKYSPLLRPSMKNGYNCIIIDLRLKEVHPDLYDKLLNFAKHHDLVITE